MGLGKYYCDYCDKEFQDTPTARKRHLQSSSHLRAKSMWYNSFNARSNSNSIDPNQVGGFTKGVCNRFIRTGFCPFGDSCKYLHPTTTTNNLHANANIVSLGIGIVDNSRSTFIPGNQLVGGTSLQGDVVRDTMGMSWGNLPPSLKPPPEGGYPPLPFVDWG